MNETLDYERAYRRNLARAAFQSMFWQVILARKRESGLTLKGLADKLGINKSYITRSFSTPPNWQIDKLSDLADALDVELVIQARDHKVDRIFTTTGIQQVLTTTTMHASQQTHVSVKSRTLDFNQITRVTA